MTEGRTGAEAVVLLHGLARGPSSMRKLQEHLEGEGFWAVSWGYPSLEKVEDEGKQIADDLLAMADDQRIDTIHLVGHSLGSLMIRYALALGPIPKIGRVVMLAPPNQGTPLADALQQWLGRHIQSLDAMRQAKDSLANSLSVPEDIEFGVIAAANDGKVPLASTHLKGEADHVVVPGFHTFVMNRADTRQYVVDFLRHGRFVREGTVA